MILHTYVPGYPKHPPPIHFVVAANTVTMKLFGILAFWGASLASSFTVPVVPSSVQRSTALFDSRRRQTIAKRTEWLKNRGVSSDAVTTSSVDTESSSGVAPGLVTSESGLEYVQLVHPDTGATSQVYLYGGVVTSYCDQDGTEFIAVRPDAVMDGSKPISGGLSHCFPQFGPGEIQQHGFARNVAWTVDTISDDSVTLSLTPNDYTKAIWDAAFRCTFTVTLEADQLATKLVVDNTGSEPWSFQAALHSYFTVSALDALEITGSFKDKEFLNKLAGSDGAGEMQTETRDTITITEEYDRVYTGVADPVLKDSGTGKALAVLNTAGWEDTVLWNPYGNEKMGYNNFVCVESVKFDAVTLEGGASWVGDMALKPSAL
jgi:glucose-6-phosphate 1-epimerase